MIIIRVELHSAVTHQVTELARMMIHNVGGTMQRRDYNAEVYRGRSTDELDRKTIQRRGELRGFPSESVHVFNLVARMLAAMGYK